MYYTIYIWKVQIQIKKGSTERKLKSFLKLIPVKSITNEANVLFKPTKLQRKKEDVSF